MSAPFVPRPKQQEVLDYRKGWMGISAVPGSGKTTTLSYLAAQIVVQARLGTDQEVLIVTLVNSAVDNFSHRIAGFVREQGLLPYLGYRVRTLHGLAHDIVRERPDLAGTSEQFTILDEEDSSRILAAICEGWAYDHQDWIRSRLKRELNSGQERRILHRDWPELVGTIAAAIIRTAKDRGISPELLRSWLDSGGGEYTLLELGWRAYREYQEALHYRGALDFDDLISRALEILDTDEHFLARLRTRWPFVLEDEAQDSSRLQEAILRKIVGPDGNWVRVGDPNQAIFETFTTASPDYLRAFLDESGVQKRVLPNSGRSTKAILQLANNLTTWVRASHPVAELRDALTTPLIEPSPVGDPQPNPAAGDGDIALVAMPYTPEEEIEKVSKSMAKFIAEYPEKTVAALVPRNFRGFELADALKAKGIPYIEILQSSRETRRLASVLADIFYHLARPSDLKRLPALYAVWRFGSSVNSLAAPSDPLVEVLRTCPRSEDLFWPEPGSDWIEGLTDAGVPIEQIERLQAFRRSAQRWQQAAQLPADQILLTIAADLLDEGDQLALAQRFAGFVRQLCSNNPNISLEEVAAELGRIAENDRRLISAAGRDSAFDPDQHPGKVVIATIHKAKGLEWDRVYVLSVNDYNFPASIGDETYISEKWFLEERCNYSAEALAQLLLLSEGRLQKDYRQGAATARSRTEYAAERLRLLYVAITRARHDLILSWNIGRRGDRGEALALTAMREVLESVHE